MGSQAPDSNIQSLATTLSRNADILASEWNKVGLGEYSLDDERAPVDLPLLSPEGSDAQIAVISAAEQILRLARGPLTHLNNYCLATGEVGTVKALVKLGIPQLIPLGESRSYKQLAEATNVSVALLQRLVRFARVCGFLSEDQDGRVKHNAMSAVFVKDERAANGAIWNLEVPFNASTKMHESLQLDPQGQDPHACAVSVAYQTEGAARPSLWDINERIPGLDQKFHDLMISSSASSLESLEHVVRGGDWENIGSVVDVGGSSGHAAFAIAARHPHIKCIVQDTKAAIATATETPNVSFQEHDFFRPQTVVADAYFYRYIIHDWSDDDAKRILAAAVPAMRTGARLIVMDMITPEPGTVPSHVEKYIRGLDVQMHMLLAGKERTLDQFRGLIAEVEPKLKFTSCVCPPGSALSLMTWTYRDDA
ncbi:putative O-methyltransferase [Aspergillus heteromorphus CBS 117.55]|uniref:Putative O-methyltransferase n=1 Tax=Aspergillus heteromorphus CBS 117.55 TaxID=1448321 RepID=A0A317X0L2_9EURO|nr:putative O-methyltransferase [Aspergillus heteromorphus CBS 117.55]PWY92199.1 putative O-methyltransferase [Aspergillus heteromorphus CBS 117.55]